MALRTWLEKFLPGEQAGFILDQQRRAAEKGVQIFRRLRAARGNPARGDGVIKIHQHLAEVEDDDGCMEFMELRMAKCE